MAWLGEYVHYAVQNYQKYGVSYKGRSPQHYSGNIDNYLRLVEENDYRKIYELCTPYKIQKLYRNDGKITMIDPVGGPTICAGQIIEGTYLSPDYISIESSNYGNDILIWVNKDKGTE